MMRSRIARIPVLGPAIIDLFRGLRDPTGEKAVQADLETTIGEVAWLRKSIPEPPADAPRLLILSLSDMVYQLKTEALLGVGLKLRGWRPVVLTNSRTNTRALRYFRAFGIRDFVFLDDFSLDETERRRCRTEAAALLEGAVDFRTVKEWSFAGSWIGPQILSTVSRTTHQGAPDPADPACRAEIEAMLPEVIGRVMIAQRVAAATQPSLGLVIEANYALYGPFVDTLIGRGTAVIQATQPWRDDALVMKRLTAATRRMHPSSISADTFATLLQRPWGAAEEAALDRLFADRYSGKWFLQSRNQPGTEEAEAEAIRRQLGLDPAKPVATIFSHVLWDANLFYGEDLFQDYGEWFVETVRAACANPNLDWLVKLHPANLWKRARDGVTGEFSEVALIRRHLGELPPHVTLLYPDTKIGTLSLFRFTDYGVTVRGTTGMELPCFGKPVLTAGTGRYSGLGFTDDSASAAEYLDRLARLHRRGPLEAEKTLLARRHAHAAFLLRPWQMKSFKASFNYRKQGVDPLDHNLHCAVGSLDEARRNRDLERWAEWAVGGEVDYLEG
jgi:hypothetical protein